MWNILKSIKKFTPKSELDKIIGAPLFQIEDRPAYYYGKGIVVFYSPKSFMIQGIQRIEYGEPGEWAVGMYHFPDIAVLKAEFGLNDFHADDAVPLEEDIIDGAVSYHSTCSEIWKWAQKNPADYQTKGVTNRLVDGQMAFNNLFIIYGQYQFFFYGKSKKKSCHVFDFALTNDPAFLAVAPWHIYNNKKGHRNGNCNSVFLCP